MKWLDFKALERDDVDKKWGLFDFLFWGSREFEKKWWFMLIPILNGMYAIVFLFVLITIPVRLCIHIEQTKKLRKNAYDIEDTCNQYRLIRNMKGDIGLCEWGLTYTYSRRVLIETQFKQIDRWGNDGYIVTNKRSKMGLFDASKNKWVFPCEYEKLIVESDDVIVVCTNNYRQRYNINGDRILG